MSAQPSIRKGMFYLSVEKVVNGAVTLAIIPFSIKMIGIEHYGLWALLITIITYLQLLDLGMGYAVERQIAYFNARNDSSQMQHCISTSLVYLLAFSLLLIPVVYFCGDGILSTLAKNSNRLTSSNLLFLLSPVIIFSMMQSVYMGIVRGLQRFDLSSKVQIAGKITFAISFVILVTRDATITSLIHAFTLQSAFTLTGYLFAAKKIAPGFSLLKLSLSLPMLKQLYTFGIKIQISSIATQITMNFDKILLSAFFGLSYTGYYDAATKVVYAIRDIPLLLMSVFTPAISAMTAKKDISGPAELYLRITRQLAHISFFTLGLLFINQHFILAFILKHDPPFFSSWVFSVISIAAFWHVISGGATYITRGIGKTGIEMRATMVTLAVNLPASLLFLKLFSTFGVPLGTAVALAVSPVVSYYLTNRYLGLPIGIFFRQSFLAPLLCCLLSAGIVELCRFYIKINPANIAYAAVTSTVYVIISAAYLHTTKNSTFRELVLAIKDFSGRRKSRVVM